MKQKKQNQKKGKQNLLSATVKQLGPASWKKLWDKQKVKK